MNVFVIMPFKESFNETYQQVIAPVVKANGMEPVVLEPVVGDDQVPGPIDAQIIESIKSSHFCIADLTGNNPNVMYEVAYAHALGKQVIFITTDSPTEIPFDIRHHRTIQYHKSPQGYDSLGSMLQKSIDSILNAGGSEVKLLRRALAPSSMDTNGARFVVAASPLSYRAAYKREGGWRTGPLTTVSDYVGIRGLMQSFGLIYGLEKLPELINPDNFDDRVYEEQKQRINLYTIGSSKSNRWTGMLMKEFFENHTPQWEFKPDPESREIMNPRVIVRQNKEKYMPTGVNDRNITEWDFGLVIRGPHPGDASCMFMVLAGRSSLGTEAASLAMTAPDCLSPLNEQLNLQGINLNDHRQAFCAVVSVKAEKRKTDLGSFTIHDIIRY